MITLSQCRAAQALFDWPQQRLAEAAQVGIVTVRQFEPRRLMLHGMRRAPEAAGVMFVDENGGGLGVRLKKASAGKP